MNTLSMLGVAIFVLVCLFVAVNYALVAGVWLWEQVAEVVAFWRYRWTEKKAEQR